MTEPLAPPAALRGQIARDMRPAPPLRRPWLRAAIALPLALLLLVWAAAVYGMRGDAGRLGGMLTWGLSILQLVLGMLLLGMSLREAVPGRAFSPAVLAASIGAAFGAVGLIGWVTWTVSPTRILREPVAYVSGICFGHTLLAAVPVIVLAGFLAARAYPLRPAAAGALYGAGAGLLADAGWRLFCHYSDPAHVLPTHLGAVVAATLLGALVGRLLRPNRRRSAG